MELDYEKLGLKFGIEIHAQLSRPAGMRDPSSLALSLARWVITT